MGKLASEQAKQVEQAEQAKKAKQAKSCAQMIASCSLFCMTRSQSIPSVASHMNGSACKHARPSW